jgi:hypothetical protein
VVDPEPQALAPANTIAPTIVIKARVLFMAFPLGSGGLVRQLRLLHLTTGLLSTVRASHAAACPQRLSAVLGEPFAHSLRAVTHRAPFLPRRRCAGGRSLRDSPMSGRSDIGHGRGCEANAGRDASGAVAGGGDRNSRLPTNSEEPVKGVDRDPSGGDHRVPTRCMASVMSLFVRKH